MLCDILGNPRGVRSSGSGFWDPYLEDIWLSDFIYLLIWKENQMSLTLDLFYEVCRQNTPDYVRVWRLPWGRMEVLGAPGSKASARNKKSSFKIRFVLYRNSNLRGCSTIAEGWINSFVNQHTFLSLVLSQQPPAPIRKPGISPHPQQEKFTGRGSALWGWVWIKPCAAAARQPKPFHSICV